MPHKSKVKRKVRIAVRRTARAVKRAGPTARKVGLAAAAIAGAFQTLNAVKAGIQVPMGGVGGGLTRGAIARQQGQELRQSLKQEGIVRRATRKQIAAGTKFTELN